VIFHVLTIFPEFFQGPFDHGVVKRAADAGILDIRIHNLRDWTFDRHKTVDDRPFGGGEGMVLKAEPIFFAVESIWPGTSGEREGAEGGPKAASPAESAPPSASRKTILLSAQGRMFDQAMANRLAEADELLLICGRYEGVDERVAEHLADEEVSIGNYVLSGGELAAAVVIDTVARLLPGVLGNESSASFDSFQESGHGEGLLDCPHWTRPAEFRGWKAPEVLMNGNHEEIRKFRRRTAIEKTVRLRPDLLK
jgi:tRNA (guanine37-N1)-methyltransferase